MLAGVTIRRRSENHRRRVHPGFRRGSKELGAVDFLVQGTVYPDVIESVSVKGPSQTIKSITMSVACPNECTEAGRTSARTLQRRSAQVGLELGLPEEMVWRQPFPGPGLGVRIMGEVTKEGVGCCRKQTISWFGNQESRPVRHIWQSFGILLPVKSVGVMGDIRTYDHTLAIRAVHSTDGMTADWVRCLTTFECDFKSHRQRSEGNQSRRLRHHVETPAND
jgi:GMP synthase (glutamine-hydrolysing)